MSEPIEYVEREMARVNALRRLWPKCGWVTGYQDCERDGCGFPSTRCTGSATDDRPGRLPPAVPAVVLLDEPAEGQQ